MPADPPFASFETFPIPKVIPVFPLPHVVFFPRTYLPLHIFEPRYRQMVKSAVASGHCIGMALLKEGWEENYYGNPAFFELGCVGRLVKVYKLPNGRYNIVLEGLERCRYREEATGSSYRQATITLCPLKDSTLDPQVRARLQEAVDTYARIKPVGPFAERDLSRTLSDLAFVNSLSAGLDFTPVEKQFLLESDDLTQQARRLLDLIRFRLSATNDAAHERDS